MTIQDQVIAALTAWRENRGGGQAGMQSVINVICNRALHRGTAALTECTRPWQFSSLTATGNPELTLWPAYNDPQWLLALSLAAQAADESLEDITGAALYYYSASMNPPPSWASTLTQTVEIEGQIFFKA